MILALLASLAPSTVQLVTPGMVATSGGQVATRACRIAGPPEDAQAARFTLTLDLEPWDAIGHTLTNLSGQAQSGYAGSAGGWIEVWVEGYYLGVSFSASTCGGYPLLNGQTANAGNLFAQHWEGTWDWDLPPALLGRRSLPVQVTLHAADWLAPGFASSHTSWLDGSAIHASLNVTYLEQ